MPGTSVQISTHSRLQHRAEIAGRGIRTATAEQTVPPSPSRAMKPCVMNTVAARSERARMRHPARSARSPTGATPGALVRERRRAQVSRASSQRASSPCVPRKATPSVLDSSSPSAIHLGLPAAARASRAAAIDDQLVESREPAVQRIARRQQVVQHCVVPLDDGRAALRDTRPCPPRLGNALEQVGDTGQRRDDDQHVAAARSVRRRRCARSFPSAAAWIRWCRRTWRRPRAGAQRARRGSNDFLADGSGRHSFVQRSRTQQDGVVRAMRWRCSDRCDDLCENPHPSRSTNAPL